MTKKDYELIAGAIRTMYFVGDLKQRHVAERMADHLEKAYPKFDRQKFLTACGIETAVTGQVPVTRDGGKTYSVED
jgi:hypothetical protein